MTFRSRCANCLLVIHEPAPSCPRCRSSRVVVIEGDLGIAVTKERKRLRRGNRAAATPAPHLAVPFPSPTHSKATSFPSSATTSHSDGKVAHRSLPKFVVVGMVENRQIRRRARDEETQKIPPIEVLPIPLALARHLSTSLLSWIADVERWDAWTRERYLLRLHLKEDGG